MGSSKAKRRGSSTKQWSHVFSQDREVADIPLLETCRTTGNKRGLLELFLQEDSGPVPSRPIERGRAFFTDNPNGIAPWLPQARAWIYKHRKSKHGASVTASHMTVSELVEALKQQGRDVAHRADINQLLVHLQPVTSEYGMALIQTVSQNNVAALRAALLGHIARTTAFRVTNISYGFPSFRMELHLPYLTLRDSHNLSSPPHIGQNPSNSKPWADLTVFEQHMSGKGTVRRSIYAAHTTIVVSGWDRHKYTAYSFLDPGPDMQAAEDEQDEDSDGDSELGESDELDHEIPPEDGFATYGWQSLVDHRSRDPRVCFLRAVQIKAIVAFKENEYLIENIREITDRIESNSFSTTSTLDAHEHQQNLGQKESFECLRQITTLLVKLREFLAETNRAWAKFNGKHGDMAYFSGLSDRLADEAINSIRDVFQDHIGLEQKVKSMEETCKSCARTLDTILSQESNAMTRQAQEANFEAVHLSKRMTDIAAVTFKAAEDTSRITHMSVYLVLATTPFIITLQYFTSEKQLFPFERNLRNFLWSILALMPLLFICALALYGVDTYKWTLFWKCYAALGGKKRQPQKNLSEITAKILELNYAPEPTNAVESSSRVV